MLGVFFLFENKRLCTQEKAQWSGAVLVVLVRLKLVLVEELDLSDAFFSF